MITEELFENRINNFWGYGNLNSPLWFIGMEEGFHGEFGDLEKRFIKTKDKIVVDLKEEMKDLKDHMKWFVPDSPMQRTWGKLIRIILTLNCDAEIDNEQIKEYQRTKLGKLNGDHCILDFMPLPCRSTKEKDWPYAGCRIDYLKSRKKYKKIVMNLRSKLLKKMIEKYSPEMVILYSLKYLKIWRKIIGTPLRKEGTLHYIKIAKTNYFVIRHPIARKPRLSNKDWNEMAMKIKDKVRNK